MKKLIILLAILCIGCRPNQYEKKMTTEILDSYVGQRHVPELKSELHEMGLYGGVYQATNPKWRVSGYVDSVYSEVYFTVDVRDLILSYDIVKK